MSAYIQPPPKPELPIYVQLRDTSAMLDWLTDRQVMPTFAQLQNHAAKLRDHAESVKRLEIFADEIVREAEEQRLADDEREAAEAADYMAAIATGKIVELEPRLRARDPAPYAGGAA